MTPKGYDRNENKLIPEREKQGCAVVILLT